MRPRPRTPFLFLLAGLLAGAILPACQPLARNFARIGLDAPPKTLVVNADTTLAPVFTWGDRRPVGILYIADASRRTPTNPGGFYWTDRAGMNAYIDRALPVLKEINAQGIIVWNPEGSSRAVPGAEYAGSPDLAATIAPEFPAAEFFGRFRAAGYKVGCLLRLTELDVATGAHNPSSDEFKTLLRKATWARTGPWKCRIFYVDSNGLPNQPTSAIVFARLHRALPDCLFIPEHGDADYHLYAARYRELRGDPPFLGFASTPDAVRAIIPAAFSCINVSEGDIRGRMAELRAALGRGDILLVNCWWRSPAFDDIDEVLRPIPTMDFKADAARRLTGARNN